MPDMSRETIKEQLLSSNAEFRQMAQDHQRYEKRLSELTSLRYPSTEEQIEEAILKKKKLQLKDQMEGIIQSYRRQSH